MKLSITLQGYRNFLEPVTITIGDGNVALIGPNNSGKSNFFRFIFEFRDILYQLPVLVGRADVHYTSGSLKDSKEYLPRDSNLLMKCVIRLEDALKPNALVEVTIENASNSNPHIFQISGKYADGQVIENGRSAPSYISGAVPEIDEIQHALQTLHRCKYYGAARTSISSHGSGKHFDFESGSQLAIIWNTWMRGDSLEEQQRAKRITEQLSSIFDLPRLSIHANIDNSDLHFIIDWNRISLREMGFGVSQFFSVLVNIAAQRPSILFIDEPETNLHASLQLKFFNALNEYCDSIVFSTHSIGLAKQVAQRIYSFIPAKPSVKVRNFVDPQFLATQLGDLSFSAHMEIGYDRILLVEGPTDIQVFQTILQTLGLAGKTVVMNLGGSSNINGNATAQIEELLRLVKFDKENPTIAVVIDSENNGQDPNKQMIKSVEDFKNILEAKGIPICVLKRRSIENYFSQQHLAKINSTLNALAEYEAVPRGWEKNNNFKLAAKMTKEEILSTDFGEFMSEHLS